MKFHLVLFNLSCSKTMSSKKRPPSPIDINGHCESIDNRKMRKISTPISDPSQGTSCCSIGNGNKVQSNKALLVNSMNEDNNNSQLSAGSVSHPDLTIQKNGENFARSLSSTMINNAANSFLHNDCLLQYNGYKSNQEKLSKSSTIHIIATLSHRSTSEKLRSPLFKLTCRICFHIQNY
jgi:hypothetical protein